MKQIKAFHNRQQARGGQTAMQSPNRQIATSLNCVRRAFSLVEVLLAIFILGVGVISIAALFPAGIAQQRLSVDEIMGPTVANNAIAIIRTKLSPDDFATFVWQNHPSVQGDFPWGRPAFYGLDNNDLPAESGINVFISADTASEIPYNADKWESGPPDIRFTLGERCYPMQPLKHRAVPAQGFANSFDGRPQYVWTPMFRRFEGKVYAAIFVYRVNGASALTYKPTQQLPYFKELLGNETHPGGPWSAGAGGPDEFAINGSTVGGMVYIAENPDQAWQEPRQWLLDQNMNIHRVAAAYRENDSISSPVRIELSRPVAPLQGSRAYLANGQVNENGTITDGVVQQLFYMPLRDGEFSLTPVYLTVKEL